MTLTYQEITRRCAPQTLRPENAAHFVDDYYRQSPVCSQFTVIDMLHITFRTRDHRLGRSLQNNGFICDNMVGTYAALK